MALWDPRLLVLEKLDEPEPRWCANALDTSDRKEVRESNESKAMDESDDRMLLETQYSAPRWIVGAMTSGKAVRPAEQRQSP